MFYRTTQLLLLALSLLLSGCATQTKMAFSDANNTIIAADKSVYLLTATIKNSFKTSHQPKLYDVVAEKGSILSKSERLSFEVDKKARIETDTPDGSTYLLRLELSNGTYVLRGFSSLSRSFPINGFFFTPVHAPIESKEPGVFYLGHIEANVRGRLDGELKAGPTLPLLDQAISGGATGTFDVEISDRWSKDEALFFDRFPILKSTKIEKRILPAFDRAFAQKWWEDN